jgi:hypothetical protein
MHDLQWRTGAADAKNVATAIYDFGGEEEDDLDFQAGDKITIVSTEDPGRGWYTGEFNGKTGVFPEDFVDRSTLSDGDTDEWETGGWRPWLGEGHQAVSPAELKLRGNKAFAAGDYARARRLYCEVRTFNFPVLSARPCSYCLCHCCSAPPAAAPH